ncbi:hypothetical protein HC022_22420 [Salipiger sp. HF18]|nr:hypothetical protein [Salipiger sp. HF18]NIY98871.1 hypothetical protein [Salipiger sp. HF18]
MRLYLPKTPLLQSQLPNGWWILPTLASGAVEWLYLTRAIYRAITGGAE